MATVMVVDDTQLIRETVAKLLRREGYDTVCASNGIEALREFEKTPPDLVLLDIMMPDMDGMEFLERLRQRPAGRSLPVIMMSALGDDVNQNLAKELGASEFLVKTRFNAGQVLERVKHWITHRPN
jgi:CheY-like chemotaxis protein